MARGVPRWHSQRRKIVLIGSEDALVFPLVITQVYKYHWRDPCHVIAPWKELFSLRIFVQIFQFGYGSERL